MSTRDPIEHTMEEDFQHFLSYSGFSNLPPEMIKVLRLSFEAATPHKPTGTIQFFRSEYDHSKLQEVGTMFDNLAHKLDACVNDNAEKAAGMRKLLESKDCFIRANIIPGNVIHEHNILHQHNNDNIH
jgi:hypothetical protein